jgi:hypothetical protein
MPNSTPACVSSACKVGSCNAGFADCNGVAADGCETNLNTSATNCGACGKVCAGGQSCVSASCVCQLSHSNGLGQTYLDCGNPLGTPGNAATYNATMATEAATSAFSGTVSILPAACAGASAALNQSGTACGVWTYNGTAAGYVHYDPGACVCPIAGADPRWN